MLYYYGQTKTVAWRLRTRVLLPCHRGLSFLQIYEVELTSMTCAKGASGGRRGFS